eukprot:jgi/Mesvir1/28788/Mv12448-RA.1
MGKKKDRRGAKEDRQEDEVKGPGKWMLRPEVQDSRYNRHAIYQRAVQTPKGEISYMLKFFLTYVGGRVPLHLREDFCGTALISMEWVKGDPRRTALGLDLDREALEWSLANNLGHLPGSARDRLALLHGNVLHDPRRAVEVSDAPAAPTQGMSQLAVSSPTATSGSGEQNPSTGDAGGASVKLSADGTGQAEGGDQEEEEAEEGRGGVRGQAREGAGSRHPTADQPADIICAFNFSTFCLQSRAELLAYFRLARGALNPLGGIFVMDMYGGTGAQQPLKIKKDYGDFLYTWEQDGFCAISQITRIHLHFRIKATNQTLKSAFTYSWRMWTIPEVRDCMTEAGFRKTFVWIRESPAPGGQRHRDRQGESGEEEDADGDRQGGHNSDESEDESRPRALRDAKYEQRETFQQCDAWGAYVIGLP